MSISLKRGFVFPWIAGLGLVVLAACGPSEPPPSIAQPPADEALLLAAPARVVAVGIPGAGAIAEIGVFHPGGPMHDRPDFAAATAPGKVLDPRRLLVASSANFGAPKALEAWAEGAILSIDPYADAATLVVPPQLAAEGGQSVSLGGAVQLYTAQAAAFLQRRHNPDAVTADLPSVSAPLAIAINNAFGRPWFANAPQGLKADGMESITDPDGVALANPPSAHAGGIFTGTITNRDPVIKAGGITAGAVATAHMGRSVDDSGFAVFAVVQADGSIAQLHVKLGIDGLAPAQTIAPVTAGRAGAVFNWVPDRILYVTDPARNSIVAIKLRAGDGVFEVERIERFAEPALSMPVDLAPAVPEVVSRDISSNTTLAGGSDIYVANRGSGTIARMTQHGEVVAVREVHLPGDGALGPDRLNGIAVSHDASTLWVTVSGELPGYPGRAGAVLQLAAFGAPGFGSNVDHLAADPDLIAMGEALFKTELEPGEGLGPLFNGRACADCHLEPSPGGMGAGGVSTVVRVGRIDSEGRFDSMQGSGGPVARSHSVSELGVDCALRPGVPAGATITSVRNAPALYGLGLIDAIPDEAIVAGASEFADGVHGRPNFVTDSQGERRVGRFGWKADLATLEDFVADALRNELGVTNPLVSQDLVSLHDQELAHCLGREGPEDDGTMVRALTAFVAALPPPSTAGPGADPAGRALFESSGCPECHTPVLPVDGRSVWLYSDLLLHDMGASLDDGVVQGEAAPGDWRTTPLWGLGQRKRFLHDGRATTVQEAILAHDGEARPAADRFRALSFDQRQQLLSFLSSI